MLRPLRRAERRDQELGSVRRWRRDLDYAPRSARRARRRAALLLAYGLGIGLPMLALGTAAGSLARRFDRLGWRESVDRGAGVTLLALGLYLLWTA